MEEEPGVTYVDDYDPELEEEFLRIGDIMHYYHYLRYGHRPLVNNTARIYINFDFIPPHIIGRINVGDLFKACPPFAVLYIRLCLPVPPDNRPEYTFRSAEERALRVARKGLPATRVRSEMAAALEFLVGPDGLFVKDDKLTRDLQQTPFDPDRPDRAYCNLFTVEKSTINPETGEALHRAIADSRACNATIINMAPMELFTLQTVIDRFSWCLARSGHGEIYAMTADLRHEFHQLPLPHRFRRFFQITMGNNIVYPRAWPMGVHAAPGIGHAVTWSLLLAGLTNPSDLRRSLGISDSEDFTTCPRWLPLACGGAIFVLIDNIFIFTSKMSVANLWRRRIVVNANRFQATLKHPSTTVGQQVVPPDHNGRDFIPNNTHAVEFVTIRRDAEEPTTVFSGIRFSGVGRKLARDIKDAPALDDDEVQEWKGTFRQAASIMSQIMWSFRIHGISLLDALPEAFMGLYSDTQPKHGCPWGGTTTLGPEATSTLRAAYRMARKNAWTIHDAPPRMPDRIIYAATDASGPPRLGIGLVFQPQSEVQREFTCRLPPFCISERHCYQNIVLGELHAVLRLLIALDDAISKGLISAADLIMLAIDSMGAKGMIERGYSKNADARKILRDIRERLKRRSLFLMYISSKQNPSDDPSRFLAFLQEKWNEAIIKLRQLEGIAIHNLTHAGSQVNGIRARG
jgi:hypothetical protein